MSEPKFTPWFSARQQPGRVGLYEVRYSPWSPHDPQCFRQWDGQLWRVPETGSISLFGWGRDKWRGLMEKAK